MNPQANLEEVASLTAILCDGRIGPEEVERLNQLLLDNPAAQDFYRRYIALDVGLAWHFAAADRSSHLPPAAPGMTQEQRNPNPLPAVAPDNPPNPQSPILGFLGDIGRQGWGFVSDHTLLFSLLAVLLAVGAALIWRGEGGAGNGAGVPQVANREAEMADPLPVPAPPTRASAPAVACLTRMQGVRWAGPVFVLGEMERLPTGRDVKLAEGRAEITFDCGVQMVLTGPAHLRILDPMRVQAFSGTITARVGKSAHGFTVVTPQGNVVDLGTEFGLRIDPAGGQEVVVFDGRVDVEYAKPQASASASSGALTRERLVAGEAVRIGAAGELSRLVSISSECFPRQVAPSAPPRRPPVIESVADNIRSPESRTYYEIVPGGLEEDALAYVDRKHEWNGTKASGIPSPLRGADYIKMFNQDKYRKTDYQITIRLSRAADLYVFLDQRVRKPQWLVRDFQLTRFQIGLDEVQPPDPAAGGLTKARGAGPGVCIDRAFIVWKRHVPGPATVTLGGLEYSQAMNMYGIAAVALDQEGPSPSAGVGQP